MKSGSRETEVKLAVKNVPRMRRRLGQLGFRVHEPRSLEKNVLFDSPTGGLRKRGALLRVRSVGGHHLLTYKERVKASTRYKVRREVETQISDAAAGKEILAGLGFQPVFRYEKYRTVYRAREGWRGGVVLLDETPIGDYLELEGSQRWIDRLARRLGARPQDYITQDYGALYAAWCRRQGRKKGDMVFRPPHRRAP